MALLYSHHNYWSVYKFWAKDFNIPGQNYGRETSSNIFIWQIQDGRIVHWYLFIKYNTLQANSKEEKTDDMPKYKLML
jgi:hypothetical protein